MPAGSPRPFFVGIAGGNAAGKSKVCKMIRDRLQQHGHEACKISVLHLRDFYKPWVEDEERRLLVERGKFNYDHPEAFDFELLENTLKQLSENKPVVLRKYDFASRSLSSETFQVLPGEVILLEGILVLYEKFVRNRLDMKIFVDVDSDTRLSKRVVEDVEIKGRSLEAVLSEYISFVKPAFEDFILPTKKFADVILPRGTENEVAIDLIVQHLLEKLASTNLSSLDRQGGITNRALYTPVSK